eukprot:CAMPEP_0113450472 /NCGR_PEP_ID=MMETSP0014_2-20120614/5846_1 /TAXON_ID=2857 /ORGANISM="Nitzschia sp." /LENGTH=428 /DNA_ID=CAMNT_0000341809 /DNA_START=163 /DNA_END=1449 /DNA_ORIENTATION=+ /assembly_acc=CAM_ASM_000159
MMITRKVIPSGRRLVVKGGGGYCRRTKSTAQPINKQTTTTTAAATTAEATTATSSSDSVPIGASLLAAAAGAAVVSTVASIVEASTSSSCLPYSETGQRFDQSTFEGRFARMMLACDPKLLLTNDEDIHNAQELLRSSVANDDHDRSTMVSVTDRDLWEARRVVDAALHPDTGDVIPKPFRMSGYVPFNGPICVAMVASTSTMPLLFWSWVNQSQNALVNYYNRNASSPMSNETLMVSYSAAVGSALTVAFGLATLIQKRFPAEKAKAMMKYVAFPSAIVASSLNCYIVRSPEIDTGVPLMDANQQPVMVAADEGGDAAAISQVAAKRGVESTTLSRALLQAPVYFLPPVLMSLIGPLRTIVERNPRTRVPITTFLLLTSFGIGLPASTALFPQVAEINVEDVEPKFQHLVDPNTQRPYEVFYYNKGL